MDSAGGETAAFARSLWFVGDSIVPVRPGQRTSSRGCTNWNAVKSIHVSDSRRQVRLFIDPLQMLMRCRPHLVSVKSVAITLSPLEGASEEREYLLEVSRKKSRLVQPWYRLVAKFRRAAILITASVQLSFSATLQSSDDNLDMDFELLLIPYQGTTNPKARCRPIRLGVVGQIYRSSTFPPRSSNFLLNSLDARASRARSSSKYALVLAAVCFNLAKLAFLHRLSDQRTSPSARWSLTSTTRVSWEPSRQRLSPSYYAVLL